ncbi:MAG TPA: translation elongation factor-like protein [Methanomicrobia archaeon]|nr:translation elongation factor-like protein [Methanomicrobia archaeon]
MAEKKLVGKITHYFSRIGVAVVELSDRISVGDRIVIEGATTALEQVVDSMEIENQKVETASAGEAVGLKVVGKVRSQDRVFRLE